MDKENKQDIQEEEILAEINDEVETKKVEAEITSEKEEDSKEEKKEKKVKAKKEKKKSSKEIIEELNQEIGESQDKYLRLNAEFQNYKKRVEKEKQDIRKFSNERIFEELIPVMDNFERALSTIDRENSTDEVSKVLEGIDMIQKSFGNVFEKHSVSKIDSLGQPFDPERHHAVMTEDSEEYDSEVVIEVLQEGYTLNGKIVRPAMVKVSN